MACNPFAKDLHGHRSDFVTFGVKHITFWEYEEQDNLEAYLAAPPDAPGAPPPKGLTAKAAQFNPKNPIKHDVLCVCYVPTGQVLAGYADGSIGIFMHPQEMARKVDGSGQQHAAMAERALARKVDGKQLIKDLHQRRSLKTVALQEILKAHRPAKLVEPGSTEGQWGWKWGGCTALVMASGVQVNDAPPDPMKDIFFSGGGDG